MSDKEIKERLEDLCYLISCGAHYGTEEHLEKCEKCNYQCNEYHTLKKVIYIIEELQKENIKLKRT